ncbi:hypothetical protein [Streptosporangium sp. NPDC002524]|uniref:hypothetical protein n=1 Tax=Streptosporangium sp. NPDC002524 TaxID=3154537 RepID=UPI003327C52E
MLFRIFRAALVPPSCCLAPPLSPCPAPCRITATTATTATTVTTGIDATTAITG